MTASTQETWIDTDRGRVYARRWAAERPDNEDQPPLVLLHDSLGCVELWRDFPQRLASATGRTVLAYDRIGFGRSDPAPGKLAPSFIHDEALGSYSAVTAHFGLRRFIALGHSVGGCMAVEVAAQRPEACAALITEAAQTFVEARTVEGIERARSLFAQPGQIDKLKRYHGDKAEWVLSAWIDTWLSPGFADWTLDAPLRQVSCPTLAIHGEDDEYGSTLHPRRIAEGVRGPARAEIISGCGHIPHRELPEPITRLMADWIAQVC
ncbi:MAG TPA: alpha/beta hydrolase [Fontimonas sp.]